MQIFVKFVISSIVVIVFVLLNAWCVQFLRFVWSSQVDTKETFLLTMKRLVSLPKASEVVVVRAPDKIYQEGKEVGSVIGTVTRGDNTLLFEMLADTANLRENLPFDYQTEQLRILSIQSRVGRSMHGTTSEGGKLVTQEYRDVIQDVTCMIVN